MSSKHFDGIDFRTHNAGDYRDYVDEQYLCSLLNVDSAKLKDLVKNCELLTKFKEHMKCPILFHNYTKNGKDCTEYFYHWDLVLIFIMLNDNERFEKYKAEITKAFEKA